MLNPITFHDMKQFIWTLLAAAMFATTSCGSQGGTPKEIDTPDAQAAAVLGEVRHMLGDSAIGKHYILKIEDGGESAAGGWKGTLDK